MTTHLMPASLPETPTRAGARAWWALAVLMLPVLLVSVDNTVLSFALPDISLALQPTSVQQLWIVDAYSLVLAALLVTMGTLGDRFGRRRILLIGATGFALLSALSAFAPTAGWLIAGRAATAVFGAMLMPATLSLIRNIFTDHAQRRIAIAVWAAMFSAGAALGPIVGGVLLEHFGWGSVFLMAVPVLIPLLVFAPLLVPECRDPQPGRIDGASVLLSVATMVPVVYAIKEMAVQGLRGPVVPLLALGAVCGVLFVRRQLRSSRPMLDMTLFTRSAFTGSLLVNMLSVIALVGFLFFITQHLQLVLGLSPVQAGLALVPALVAMIISGFAVVPLAARFPARVVIPAGLLFSVIGYVGIALTTNPHTLWPTVVASVSLGIGIGMAETVSNDLILASAPAAKAGAASAVSETAYEVGTVLGTSVIGGLLTAVYRGALSIPDGVPAHLANAARETLAGASDAAQALGGSLGRALWRSATEAFDSGVLWACLIGAGLIAVAGVIAAATLRESEAPVDVGGGADRG